jgi:hypothetical protein
MLYFAAHSCERSKQIWTTNRFFSNPHAAPAAFFNDANADFALSFHWLRAEGQTVMAQTFPHESQTLQIAPAHTLRQALQNTKKNWLAKVAIF